MKHIASSFVGAAMSRTPKAGDTCRDAGEGVCAGRTSKTNSRCRRVLLVIGMEDENLVHRRFDNRVDYIFFSRYAKNHAQEIASIAKVVIWIKERLTSRIFIGHCSEKIGGASGRERVCR